MLKSSSYIWTDTYKGAVRRLKRVQCVYFTFRFRFFHCTACLNLNFSQGGSIKIHLISCIRYKKPWKSWVLGVRMDMYLVAWVRQYVSKSLQCKSCRKFGHCLFVCSATCGKRGENDCKQKKTLRKMQSFSKGIIPHGRVTVQRE